eukprot:4400673-Pyramimonas_sp.AAC.1
MLKCECLSSPPLLFLHGAYPLPGLVLLLSLCVRPALSSRLASVSAPPRPFLPPATWGVLNQHPIECPHVK